MSEVKTNIEEGKEGEMISYTLREVPKSVHDEVASYKKEIAYKRDRDYNIEQTYVEILKEWAAARLEAKRKLQPV